MQRWTMLATFVIVAIAGACQDISHGLRISWTDEHDILTIRSDEISDGPLEVWYLEAFCRHGSTVRDWDETVIEFESKLVDADPAGRWLKLKTIVDKKVYIDHTIRASDDEVDFQMTLMNPSDQAVDIEWCQPCIRVGRFTGCGQDDYFEKCFIFTDQGLTRMHQTHRTTEARYTPGQVYVPAGIDLNDVNPRPISKTRPVNGLVGCFSADEKMILATAWYHTQELFQGVIICLHSDPHIGGLKAHQTKQLHGKIYLVPNDVDALLKPYHRDFGKSSPTGL